MENMFVQLFGGCTERAYWLVYNTPMFDLISIQFPKKLLRNAIPFRNASPKVSCLELTNSKC